METILIIWRKDLSSSGSYLHDWKVDSNLFEMYNHDWKKKKKKKNVSNSIVMYLHGLDASFCTSMLPESL